jgi:hypothetical protein
MSPSIKVHWEILWGREYVVLLPLSVFLLHACVPNLREKRNVVIATRKKHHKYTNNPGIPKTQYKT